MRAPPDVHERIPDQEGFPLFPNARRRFRAALVGVALASAALAPAAATLPATAQQGDAAWPQFQGGPEHRGVLAEGPEPPYRTRWTFPAPGGGSLSAAVIVDDVAITVGERAVYAVDVATGRLLWEVDRAGGPLSTPAIASGNRTTLLYVDGGEASGPDTGASPSGSPASPTSTSPTSTSPTSSPSAVPEDDLGSVLVALDLADRSERWRAPLQAESRSGVTVDADTAYVGDEDGTVYAVALLDGHVRWTADLGEGTAQETTTGDRGCEAIDDAAVDVPIAVAEDRVVVIGRNVDGGAVAVGAFTRSTGVCVWRVFPQIGSSAVSAAAAGEGIVVVGSADRFVRALGAGDGQERWSSLALSLFSPLGSPAFAPGTVYVADLGGGLYRLEASDGARVWDFQFNEVALSSPVLSGNTVLLGLRDGRLVAVDASSGHLVWQGAASPGRLGTIALTSDAVVVEKAGRDSSLIAFEHDPQGRLVNVPSPTRLELPTTLSRIGIAAAVVLAALLVPGLLIRRRFGVVAAGREGDTDGVDGEPEEVQEP